MTNEGDLCPPLTPGSFDVSTVNRTVGQVVEVLCQGRPLSTLLCLPGGRWNASLPACPPAADATSSMSPSTGVDVTAARGETEAQAEEEYRVEAVVIIVWALGGLLLLALAVLLAVILVSRRKGRTRHLQQPRSSVYTVTRSLPRQGGDNLGFRGSNWSLQRHTPQRASHSRPPSYHEAIAGRMLVLPSPGGAVRSPPSLNPSSPPALTPASSSNGGARPRETTPNASRARGSEARHSRYAQEYPSCFWEEDPPPPYTPFSGAPPSSRPQQPPRDRAERVNAPQATSSPRPGRSRPAPLARLEQFYL